MQFGLDGSRDRGGPEADAEASARELTPLRALVAEARAAGLISSLAQGDRRADRLIAYARLLGEIARRSGQVELMARAASAASRARHEAGEQGPTAADAFSTLADIQRLGFLLFSDADAAEQARRMAEAALDLNPVPIVALRARALLAQIGGAQALAAGDRTPTVEAIHILEAAVKAAAALRAGKAEIAAIALARADLMIGLGAADHDRSFLASAEAALADQAEAIDPDRLPLTWMRGETLRGQALVAIGDVAGDAASIAEGVAALKAAVAGAPLAHSPLDAARARHGLGLALEAMGEACDEEALFDRAVEAFAPALSALKRAPTLPFRAIVAHDGAVCLARRAERRRDLKALEDSEAVFREALKTRDAASDPLAWAVTQVALARIYEAQATLRPDSGERADAAFALASALDVFAERGLRTLSASALAALDRLKERV